MPEVQNVGAVDYAQYQPSQYQETSPEYVSEPEVYDEHADQMRAATKSRLGATILSLAVVGGLALWGGHAWGKKSAKDAQIELVKETIAKFEKATTVEELEAIMPEFLKKGEELSKNYTEEENTTTYPEVAELMTKMQEAAQAAQDE